jgi:hypothetical protein
MNKNMFATHKVITNNEHLFCFYGSKFLILKWCFWFPKSNQIKCALQGNG